jgi:Ca2+-binding RTX toxin-like protein
LDGGNGDDQFSGGVGNDTIDGGSGDDTLVLAKPRSEYTVLWNSALAVFTINSKAEGVDSAPAVESFKFSDVTLSSTALSDTTPPSIAITSTRTNLIIGQTATLNFAISEAVSDFVIGDITASGGKLSNFSGSGNSYSATFTPTANSSINGIVMVGNGKFSDAAGNFNVDGSDANNTVTIAVNTIEGTVKVGTSSDNSLSGGTGNDILDGMGGNDTLDGGAGTDTLYGGTGNDTFYVDNAGDSVVELAGEGTDTEIAGLSAYLPANVENLTLTGNAYFGVGNALDNVITGSNTGNLLLGGVGDDTVVGGDARDAIFGESGNDSISGGSGIDYLVAGTGNDTIEGGAGADEAYGEDGNDSISGGSDFQTDILVGGAGNDTIDGGPAWDLMYGSAGDDTFYASQQVDWVFENPNEGYDTVIAESPNGYYLFANLEALTLIGTTPFGVGNDLANLITGNAIGNVLLGGAGNDTLDGGAGQDILWGEAGSDTFLIRKGTGMDIIADFTLGTDHLDVRDYGFKSTFELMARMTQVGTDISVDLGGGDSLILMGVKVTILGATDLLVV